MITNKNSSEFIYAIYKLKCYDGTTFDCMSLNFAFDCSWDIPTILVLLCDNIKETELWKIVSSLVDKYSIYYIDYDGLISKISKSDMDFDEDGIHTPCNKWVHVLLTREPIPEKYIGNKVIMVEYDEYKIVQQSLDEFVNNSSHRLSFARISSTWNN